MELVCQVTRNDHACAECGGQSLRQCTSSWSQLESVAVTDSVTRLTPAAAARTRPTSHLAGMSLIRRDITKHGHRGGGTPGAAACAP